MNIRWCKRGLWPPYISLHIFIIFFKLSWYIVIRFFRHGRRQRTFDIYYLSIINPTNLNLNMSCCMRGAFDIVDETISKRSICKWVVAWEALVDKTISTNQKVSRQMQWEMRRFWDDNEWTFFYLSFYNPPWKDCI